MTSPPSGCQRDFHPRAVEHARHTIEKPELGAPAFSFSHGSGGASKRRIPALAEVARVSRCVRDTWPRFLLAIPPNYARWPQRIGEAKSLNRKRTEGQYRFAR